MAATRREATTPLTAEGGLQAWLFRQPYDFRFFQAVRLLHRLYPERQPVGHDNAPGREVVRFRARLSLTFPPSELFDLGWGPGPLDYDGGLGRAPAEDGPAPPPTMTVAFMGLFGPLGVLPRPITDQLLRLEEERERQVPERHALRAWLDLFNHRLISLFYRAWEKYRVQLGFEAGTGDREADPLTGVLLSLVGLGTRGLRDRLRVLPGAGRTAAAAAPLARIDDLALLRYAGFLAQRRRCAESLEALLEGYFGLPVAVEQFRGQWFYLDESRQSSLRDEESNSRLGCDTIAGTAVWDAQSKFRVRVGPLRYARFNEFLPDRTPLPARKSFFLLCHLVRLYVGPDLDFDVQLVLAAPDVPACELSDNDPTFPRLGWNTWAGPLASGGDADDVVFEAEEVVWLGGP